MKIDITGNPGTGNTFQEIHIGTVQNYNPNATTVINNNYGDKQKPAPTPDKTMQDAEKEALKADIMGYVGRLNDYVAKEWKNRFNALWTDILALPEVDAEVYATGRQAGTTFNRNLIANIIHIMYTRGVLNDGNDTQFAIALEGDKEHSVRQQLGKNPKDEISDRVKALIDRQ